MDDRTYPLVSTVGSFDIVLKGKRFFIHKDGEEHYPDGFESASSAETWCKRQIKEAFVPFQVVTRINDYNRRSYIGVTNITAVYLGDWVEMKLKEECTRIDGSNHSNLKNNVFFLFAPNSNNLKICDRITEIWDKQKRLRDEENELEKQLTEQLSKNDILKLTGIKKHSPTPKPEEAEV